MGDSGICIIIHRFAIEDTVTIDSDDGCAALRVLFVDAGVGEVVDGHAVGEADATRVAVTLVKDREVVVVIVATEDALHSVRQARFKEIVGTATAEYEIGRAHV